MLAVNRLVITNPSCEHVNDHKFTGLWSQILGVNGLVIRNAGYYWVSDHKCQV